MNLTASTLLSTVAAVLTIQAGAAKSTSAASPATQQQRLVDHVDPRIGSQGLGRTFIGPSHPFGMAKPSPDCTPSPNSGWLPMPERVDGFSQTHVSGTGGGPKYGNISVMPFIDGMNSTSHIDYRRSEEILPAYYSTTLDRSAVTVEVTAAPRAAVYRFTYPPFNLEKGIAVDAGFFLGEEPVPDAREAQQLVGSQVQIVDSHALQGYSRIRGGWNNGRAYTVYFYALSDTPFTHTATWRGDTISTASFQTDHGDKTGALLQLPDDTRQCQLTVGISFLSELKARENCLQAIAGKDFDTVRRECLDAWETLLGRITIDPLATLPVQRMFYTALYHTMLMPVDRTGECPLWNDPTPYYDDYYAIWDTYRTSTPLITLIAPDTQRDIVNSLITIARRDGYMPDARSGNANGRTQGGSNADIVLADAMAKQLGGIDWHQALQAMLTDGDVDPGHDHEAHGRGSLGSYISLGYIPCGTPRAGNRTVEYSFNDWAIAYVARQLGNDSIARRYEARSHNWLNLWRDDCCQDGVSGFIMPRNARGEWLDSIPYGHSTVVSPTFTYTPTTFEGPWHTPWWSMFFYEASSWEYSLSVPHDIPLLIDKCGGPAAMEKRLDTFFDHGYFNVNNEPSFLTPHLYHWLGKPHRSSDRTAHIIDRYYNDTPAGLPGNDDSGAMSSWLAFNILGLYPNAGHDYYLLHTPLVDKSTFNLPGDKTFTITTRNRSRNNRYITSATLNGKPYPYSTISHNDMTQGGELILTLGPRPGNWGAEMFPPQE